MRLARRDRIADDIYALTLTCEQDAPLPEIAPGDHIEVQVPGGARAYSLCNPPDAREGYQLAIHRSSRMAARTICARRLPSARPCGCAARAICSPCRPSIGVVLIAGGIGITPIIAMAEHQRGATWISRCTTARSRAAAAFLDRLDAGACRHRVRYHFDDDPAAGRLDLGRLFAGLDADQHVYLCGPNAMLADAVTLAERHALAGRLHYERFGASRAPPAPSVAPGHSKCWRRAAAGASRCRRIARSPPRSSAPAWMCRCPASRGLWHVHDAGHRRHSRSSRRRAVGGGTRIQRRHPALRLAGEIGLAHAGSMRRRPWF